MKRVFGWVVCSALWVLSTGAWAQTPPSLQGTLRIDKVGVNNIAGSPNINKGYLIFTPEIAAAGCSAGPGLPPVFNFDLTTATGRAMYAQVLIAKISGRPLSRIHYVVGATCSLVFVELQADN